MGEVESALDLILNNQEGAVQNLSTKIPDSTEGEALSSSPQRMVRSDRISPETAESIWKGVAQQLDQERKLLLWVKLPREARTVPRDKIVSEGRAFFEGKAVQ